MSGTKIKQEPKIESGNFRQRSRKALKETAKQLKENKKQKLDSARKEQQRNAKS